MRHQVIFLGLLLAVGCAGSEKLADIGYATVDGMEVRLDLYLAKEKGAPVVVYVHGGAWRSGSKEKPPVAGLVEEDFAVASVNYRLSPVAKFPDI